MTAQGGARAHARSSGITSRLRRAPGRRHPWTAPGNQVVDLPVVLDVVNLRSGDWRLLWQVEATVDLVDGCPRITRMVVACDSGLDPAFMQEKFRWATPLDVVTRTVPQLLAKGLDPFNYEYATHDYPDAADVDQPPHRRLTDEFLEDVARRYVALGRGYAAVIARERDVTPRTVVSWVEKARRRGILSPARSGAAGGVVVPADERPHVP